MLSTLRRLHLHNAKLLSTAPQSLRASYTVSAVTPSYLAPSHKDTIFALSSAPGKAGVAIIRISGPRSSQVITKMARAKEGGTHLPNPRYAVFRRILHPISGDLLDRGLILWFPGPTSFTGEDVVELHVHGGNAVVRGVLDALGSIDSTFRLAERGEFSRRAFDNDKLDLTSIEGLADLLNAETEAQRKQALRQAEGGLKHLYESWRTQLIKNMALLEAIIDFGEDEGIEDGIIEKVITSIRSLSISIRTHMDDNRRGEILREGIHVTILGPPNAGKSSFLNRLGVSIIFCLFYESFAMNEALYLHASFFLSFFLSASAQRQAAIVSPIPGTTRDIIEVALNVAGYPVVVGDTAGLRSSEDMVEMEGIRRAKDRIDSADLKICILSLPELLSTNTHSLDSAIRDFLDPDTLLIFNKSDLVPTNSSKNDKDTDLIQRALVVTDQLHVPRQAWALSCETGVGFDQFLGDFVGILRNRFDTSTTAVSSGSLITQARHRAHLKDCVTALDAFLANPQADVVLAAEELRQAAGALGRITGRVDVEEVLEVVFREFCIGK
ncbi:tRNA modification GTPase GTPBP3, mitochondrial-like protein [Endogone sp. FLAS-F59071]|nr:tRNA modification GTPase GTPBP3, mitochondrial-like protein [Endogone sp. FLAS-F59071]|eukprot:RUS15961.1 tRNA modification GTPase GTPBP3, mitochondrial-like protein [Endogone sp. FLAS-F59071]